MRSMTIKKPVVIDLFETFTVPPTLAWSKRGLVSFSSFGVGDHRGKWTWNDKVLWWISENLPYTPDLTMWYQPGDERHWRLQAHFRSETDWVTLRLTHRGPTL